MGGWVDGLGMTKRLRSLLTAHASPYRDPGYGGQDKQTPKETGSPHPSRPQTAPTSLHTASPPPTASCGPQSV